MTDRRADADKNHPNEFALTERIRRATARPVARVRVGIGDDAAVCESPQAPLLLCSDAMVEGTHFRLDWCRPEDLGHKALAACLSDIAAMRGRPLYALVSLALRPDLPADFIDRFYMGLETLAARLDVAVVGGDLARADHQVFVDIALAGAADAPATRSGARPGDLLLVSGTLGSARAGLVALEGAERNPPAELLDAHLRPEPRFDVARALDAPGLVTAMIDVSDGLAADVRRLARASACGFIIEETAIPIATAARDFASARGIDPLDWAWSGGEDYQLLVAVDPDAWSEQAAARPELKRLLTPVGRATAAEAGVQRVKSDGTREDAPDSGWDHFRR